MIPFDSSAFSAVTITRSQLNAPLREHIHFISSDMIPYHLMIFKLFCKRNHLQQTCPMTWKVSLDSFSVLSSSDPLWLINQPALSHHHLLSLPQCPWIISFRK